MFYLLTINWGYLLKNVCHKYIIFGFKKTKIIKLIFKNSGQKPNVFNDYSVAISILLGKCGYIKSVKVFSVKGLAINPDTPSVVSARWISAE